jgi:hypothetical protein
MFSIILKKSATLHTDGLPSAPRPNPAPFFAEQLTMVCSILNGQEWQGDGKNGKQLWK